jgi:DeoR/GlpR family transcriptional regulator of sugar metabolism
MRDRDVRIFDILSVHKSVKITTFAELLGVSHVTVRKDLKILEDRGIVKFSHGHVALNETDGSCERMVFNHLTKLKIAKAAINIINEGEMVMVESGSCCALFAEELALADKNITIITNSISVACCVSRSPKIKIILLGGNYQPDSRVVVGSMATSCAKSFLADKFFLGADGFIPGYGFTNRDYKRAETISGLTNYANNVFVLTESEKFKRRGACEMLKMNKLTGVFTDDSIPKEAENALCKNNVKLYKVSAA